ncbi:hypothetical protein [Natronococcus roseus]|uniref:hypothetical protein n=1 Tax=Natronococcus roseus TaxID=1052014 RepID=UPI00374D9C6F
MTQWIQVTETKQNGNPTIRRIKRPDPDEPIWFTEKGYAEVSESLATDLSMNLDVVEEVPEPDEPGEYFEEVNEQYEIVVEINRENGTFDVVDANEVDSGSVRTEDLQIIDGDGWTLVNEDTGEEWRFAPDGTFETDSLHTRGFRPDETFSFENEEEIDITIDVSEDPDVYYVFDFRDVELQTDAEESADINMELRMGTRNISHGHESTVMREDGDTRRDNNEGGWLLFRAFYPNHVTFSGEFEVGLERYSEMPYVKQTSAAAARGANSANEVLLRGGGRDGDLGLDPIEIWTENEIGIPSFSFELDVYECERKTGRGEGLQHP